MSNTKKNKITTSQKVTAGVTVGVIVLSTVMIKNRRAAKLGKLLVLAEESAVSDWVAANEKAGFHVLLLSTSVIDKLTDMGVRAIPNAA